MSVPSELPVPRREEKPAKTAFTLPRDLAIREMVELITGQPVESEAKAWRLLAKIEITEDAMRLFGWVGLSTLLALSRRGDRKAAEALVNHAIGLPDKPFREAAREMDAETAAEALYQTYRELGMTEKQARAKVEKELAPVLARQKAHG